MDMVAHSARHVIVTYGCTEDLHVSYPCEDAPSHPYETVPLG